jgi:hypothetical protein
MVSVSDCGRFQSLDDLTGQKSVDIVSEKKILRVLNYIELVIYKDTE